uniref:MAM domain-containing protein n=1 Tax=Panagrolaimus davidi TaxID=227884 RepID=A0A914PAH9_9BILA
MGDELDWIRARNSWGREEGLTIFGTEETATHCYILVGSQSALPPENAALLVSDPVQCQEGDGKLTFRFWTSPKTEIKVCIRKPGLGKFYDWCSCPITKGDPGPVAVIIPGSIMYTFEIVIEASHFDFNAFGVQGGVVIIDDITYEATAVYNCRYIPHVDPPIPISEETCETIYCTFDDGKCIDRIRSSGWRLSDEPTGNLHTGIRMLQDKSFACSKGVGTKLEFVAEDIQSGYAYIGLDSIRLVDPQTYQDMCSEQLASEFTPAPSEESDTLDFTTTPSSPFQMQESDKTLESSDVEGFIEEKNNENISGLSKAAGSPVIKIRKLNINRKSATPFPENFDETTTITSKDPFGFKPIAGIVYGRKKSFQKLEELPELF